MRTNTQRQKMQTQTKSAPVKTPGVTPSTAVPNSVMASMMGVSDRGGYAIPNLDQIMRERFALVRQIPSAEREADRLAQGAAGAKTPDEVKSRLGESMGADFSSVRFHTGGSAQGKADSMGARAYTAGRDVYFGEGGFDPGVAAHELVHTAQQGFVSSAVDTMSAPTGGVQMMPHPIDWLWRKTGGKIQRDHHDAMNDLHRAVTSGEWDQLPKEKQEEWRKSNRVAYNRYMKNEDVRAETAKRVKREEKRVNAAKDFWAMKEKNGEIGKTSRIGDGSEADQPVLTAQKRGKGVLDTVVEKADTTGTLASTTASIMDTYNKNAPNVQKGATGLEHGAGLIAMGSDLKGGVDAFRELVNAAEERDGQGAMDAGLDLGENVTDFGAQVANFISGSGEVGEKVAERAGTVGNVLALGTGAIQMYKGGKKAIKGAQKRSALSDIQKKLGKREDLEGRELVYRDIATMGKMQATKETMEGTGEAISAALNTAGAAADLSGVGAPVGMGLELASLGVQAGTKAATLVQEGRMKEKINEQTLGLTDELIEEYMEWYNSQHKHKINRSRAKQALLQAKGYTSGYRSEVMADQTEKRADLLAEEANEDTEMGRAFADAMQVERDKKTGKYTSEGFFKAQGGDKSRSQIVSKKRKMAALVADNNREQAEQAAQDAIAAKNATATPAAEIAGKNAPDKNQRRHHRHHRHHRATDKNSPVPTVDEVAKNSPADVVDKNAPAVAEVAKNGPAAIADKNAPATPAAEIAGKNTPDKNQRRHHRHHHHHRATGKNSPAPAVAEVAKNSPADVVDKNAPAVAEVAKNGPAAIADKNASATPAAEIAGKNTPDKNQRRHRHHHRHRRTKVTE